MRDTHVWDGDVGAGENEAFLVVGEEVSSGTSTDT